MKTTSLLSLLYIATTTTSVFCDGTESSTTTPSCINNNSDEDCPNSSDQAATNGKMLELSMLQYDSIAFLVFVDLNIAPYIMKRKNMAATPQDVAAEFNLSVRAASALMVTLCRQGILQIARDNEESVDEIHYELSPSATLFLNPEGEATTTNFIQSMKDHFWSPESLLEASRPTTQATENKDKMSEFIEETDETKRDNARAFMRHMNSQSYSCAKAFPSALGLETDSRKSEQQEDNGEPPSLELLDVGGGSAIYTIAAARANPKLTGTIFELASTKAVTEEFIAEANMSDRIKVVAGDFFSDEPFPEADIVLFSNILHDWPDETNMELLKKAHECLRPGGRVVVSELLLADNLVDSPQTSTSMNIAMLQWTKGRQYRGKELIRRMERIGFVDSSVSELVDDYSLVVGYKRSTD